MKWCENLMKKVQTWLKVNIDYVFAKEIMKGVGKNWTKNWET